MSTEFPTDEEEAVSLAMEIADVEEIIKDLLPRASRILDELKEGTDAKTAVGQFIVGARQYNAGLEFYTGQYYLSPDWIGENVLPVILSWEHILETREHERQTSNFLGVQGAAIIVEGTVTFATSFENEWGIRYLTILKDDAGNTLKYWNTFNLVDPIQSEAQGMQVKRAAAKGDKIRLKATVKEHEIYKGVRQTTLMRARKVELIQAAQQNEAPY